MIEYKGYTGHVTYDDEADIFHGEVMNTRDVITFQGKSTREIKRAFKDSIDTYLRFCKKKNRTPDKPFSGKILLRVPPEDHQAFFLEAKISGMSLNSWVKQALKAAAHIKPNRERL